MERRRFFSFFAATGLTSTLFPGVLWAQIQPGTKKVSLEMIRESARLAGLSWTEEECQELADSLSSLARHAEGIGKPSLTNASPLPIHFNPLPPGIAPPALPPGTFRIEPAPRVRRPQNVEEAAFWPLTHLAHLLQSRQVTSLELTTMYLARLKRFNPQLNCVAALTEERAMHEAAAADKAIASGNYLGVLHGIPYRVKDIIAARGAPTRWGSPPLESQVIDEDATVVRRLHDAGAVLIAKLATGEMAFGDQWAGGRTNNPWRLAEGSSGSSAGSGAAPAAGCVGFAIGSDTGGSILSPAVRCGLVGLRPTFGRVSRYGVMAAGTTLDKIGPMCRDAQDCAIVLRAIAGPDNLDLAVPRDVPVSWDTGERPLPEAHRHRLRDDGGGGGSGAARQQRARAGDAEAPRLHHARGDNAFGDLSYFIEYIERAAAFDTFTNSGQHRGLQPRTSRYLRAGQLITAVDYLQANRRRAVIMQDVAQTMSSVDAVMFTSLTLDSRTSLNPAMSLTGHPSLAVPNGFRANGTPTGVMFSGQLYREGDIVALAKAWQDGLEDPVRRPPLFGAR